MLMSFCNLNSVNFFSCIIDSCTYLAITTADCISKFPIYKSMCSFVSIIATWLTYNITKRKFLIRFYNSITNSFTCNFYIINSIFIIINDRCRKTTYLSLSFFFCFIICSSIFRCDICNSVTIRRSSIIIFYSSIC